MLSFQYKHGDRPLEGYTIQRGAGRGGFGEVYYAISDTGREVALKALTAYEQIELRGISHCMNLKNPHLVTIFDVRYNDPGRPFVIMEYVAGPSLRQLLDESPSGLGTQKSAFFLREIAKGLTFLHDHGIVHRDLKPANIFYENGYVKIGDYGLSKLIATTHTSAQTVTVGTVHYMAPEIGAGKYDRSIDIYALGAVLFEMLTGMVPFTGASPGEVLLKHLGTEPDVTAVPEPFATVIRKAMAKDPAQRYQNVQEMVEAVFGAEHIRQSVSVFSPDQLSMVAAHAAQRVPVGAGVGAAGASSTPPPNSAGASTDRVQRAGQHLAQIGDRLVSLGDRVVDMGVRAVRPRRAVDAGVTSRTMEVTPPTLPVNDPMTRGQRAAIALITCAFAGVLGAALNPNPRNDGAGIFVFFACAGGAAGIRLAVRHFLPQMPTGPETVHRIGIGGLASIFAAVFSFPAWVGGDVTRNPGGLWLAICLPLFFMNASAWAMPSRAERVTFWNTIALAGLFGWILSGIFLDGSPVPAITVAGICAVTQILSPWDPTAARAAEEAQTEEKPMATPNVAAAADHPASLERTAAQIEAKLGRRFDRAARKMERRRWREMHPRERQFSFFSPIVLLLLLAAAAVTLMCALRLADFFQAGLPDPSFGRDLDQFFAGVSDWPRVLTSLGSAAAVLLTTLAAAASAMARRRGGILHILRGVFGIALMIGSLGFIGAAFGNRHAWSQIAHHVNQNQPAAAIAAFVDAFQAAPLAFAAMLFVLATVIIAWPRRRREPAAQPQPDPAQGAAK